MAPPAESSIGTVKTGAAEPAEQHSYFGDLWKTAKRSVIAIEQNTLAPALNSMVIEPINAVSNGLNGLSYVGTGAINKITGTSFAAPELGKVNGLTVDKAESGSAAHYLQEICGTAGTVLTYAVAGKLAGKSLTRVGNFVPLELEISSLAVGKAFQAASRDARVATVFGATTYAGLRDTKEGESHLSNAASTLAAFTIFETGNSLIDTKGLSKFSQRFGVGMAGGYAQADVTSLIQEHRLANRDEIGTSVLSGAVLNAIMPSGRKMADAAEAGVSKALTRAPGRGLQLEPGENLAELKGQLPTNRTDIGVDLKLKVTADGQTRPVTVHLPPRFNPVEPTPVYWLMDGVQVNKPAGNMLGINGWARTADAHGVVAINIEQSPASSLNLFGIRLPKSIAGYKIPNVTSWSHDHGILNKTSGIDDVRTFAQVHGQIQEAMNVHTNNIVTFSDGGPLAHSIAAKMSPGSIDGVANVGSTVMYDAPRPQPDIAGFFVNCEHDPTIPLKGGAGPKLTKILARVGQRNILKSQPELQPIRYAEANGLTTPGASVETPVYVQTDYVAAGEDAAKVRAFVLKKGGHTWPGRDLGDGSNTALTKANGDTVSHDDFPTNDLIVKFFQSGKKVQRKL